MAAKISGYIRDEILTFTRIKKRGFFVPYRYASDALAKVESYAEVEAYFEKYSNEIQSFIKNIATSIPAFQKFGQQDMDPSWEGGMFPPLDGAAAYTAVVLNKPKRIIEVGSGSSTHFLSRAARDLGIGTQIICIDPKPRQSIMKLDVQFEQRVLSINDIRLFDDLENCDIMFIDSSHLMMEGLDLDIILNRILPRLKPGVIVHFHDIFLPHGYPADWSRRRYSEQNALVGWLLSGFLNIEYPGYFAVKRYPDIIARSFAGFPPLKNLECSSLWVRRSQSSEVRPASSS